MAAAVLSACGSNKEAASSSPAASSSEAAAASTSAAPSPSATPAPEAPALDFAKLAADYKEIVGMAEGKKDPKAIQEAYKKNFQPHVQAIDAGLNEGDPKMDENISFVIDNAVKGQMNADQLTEAVEKGLNWFFYLQTGDFVNKYTKSALAAGDYEKAAGLLEQALQGYTAVLEPFVEKRDATFKTNMKDSISSAVIPALRADVKAGKLADYNVHRQMWHKTLIKAFTLATWSYGEKMPKVTKEEAPKEMTEGYFLFLPVYTYLKGGSEADANAVKDAFASGDTSKVDPAKIKASLIAANSGKVKEYLETSQTELQEGKKDEARVHAMEAAMFLSSQEVFMGADYAAAASAGEAYVKAIDDGKADEAKKQADSILAALAKL
jgi:tetratricopeptide (TPR) repeat protein